MSSAWPTARSATGESPPDGADSDDALVRSLPVCISSEVWSAGTLGATLLYRYQREGRRLQVGYFVYWSAERPWGSNFLSYSLLPALFIDAFYSHLLFVLPGAQQVLYGPGDVEGARVVYEQAEDGRWTAVSGVADNAAHQEVALTSEDIVDHQGAVVLRSDVWSHQLSGARRDETSHQAASHTTCFVGASLSPLTSEVVQAFRLGSPLDPRRAGPAWNFGVPDESTAASRVARAQPRRTRLVAAVEP